LPDSLFEVILMTFSHDNLSQSTPSIDPHDLPAMSDDQCLVRLAQAVESHDVEQLDEVARLIGRLAVAIE
jgi:hypothetical protein